MHAISSNALNEWGHENVLFLGARAPLEQLHVKVKVKVKVKAKKFQNSKNLINVVRHC